MSMAGAMPRQVAIAIDDFLDNCGQIQPGQNVLIVAALDGLYGGVNIVDEQTVNWLQAAVQQRRAYASVLWLDMPIRPDLIWAGGKVQGWRVPPVLRGALSAADAFINLCVDLSFEEEIKEVRDICAEFDVPMLRNMATTAPMLASTWAQTPYELVSEIRFQTASLLEAGSHWTLTHRNGTHLEGTVGRAASARVYASRRTEGLYRPFPEGVFPALTTTDAEGELVFEGTNPIWARHIGIPSSFQAPIRLTIREGHIREFKGGAEADALKTCYGEISKELGDDAYHIRGTHGGVHPHAHLSAHQVPDAGYRDFIEHHHWSSQHVHLGNGGRKESFPYNMHVTAEIRGATLEVGDKFLWKEGRLTVLDHPEVRAIAAKYPDRPGLDPAAGAAILP